MRNWLIVIALAGLTMSGCAPVERMAVFDEKEYIPFAGDGTSSIVGQAFLRAAYGEPKFAAGLSIFLTPVTSYSAEWFTREVLGHRRLTVGDPRAYRYVRRDIGDAEGRFSFNAIPAGRYYVTCEIHWEEEEEFFRDTAYAVVEVGPGVRAEVVVTRPDRSY